MNLKSSLSAGVAAIGLLLLAGQPSLAADAKAEIDTAGVHAGLAAGSPDLAMLQKHLHHVINCLVGPKDAAFDAAPGNPCKDQGMGAIPDSSAAGQKSLEAAVKMAKDNLGQMDLAKAKEQATALQAALKKAAM